MQVVAARRLGRIEFGVAGQPVIIDARLWKPADRLTLKVLAWKGNVEVYADDRLMIHQSCPSGFSGSLGFVVDEAEAAFSEARYLAALPAPGRGQGTGA